MKRWSYSILAVSMLFCLLAWIFVPVLSHWRWRQDDIGGPQAGFTHTHAASRAYTHSPQRMLADAKTLLAALRYICESESPSAPDRRPANSNTAEFATNNIVRQGFSVQAPLAWRLSIFVAAKEAPSHRGAMI